MSSDKRRRTDESHRPSKKRKAASDPDAVTFRLVSERPSSDAVWAVAPGVSVPSDVQFDAYARKTGRAQERELLLHASVTPQLGYVAREDALNDYFRHYLGVYDASRQEVQLVPVRKMLLRADLGVQTASPSDSDAEAPPSALKRRQDLGAAFGTKKARKALQAYSENAIQSPQKAVKVDASGQVLLDDSAVAVMDSMAPNSSIATRDAMQDAVKEAKPIPKANPNAKTPREVYPMEALVGADVLDLVSTDKWRTTILAGKAVETRSRFVARRVQRIVETEQWDRLRALRLLLTLITWFTSLKPAKGGARKLPPRDELRSSFPDVDGSLLEIIRKRFAPSITMTKWDVDYFITHVLAIALSIDEFELDTFDLVQDLRLEFSACSQYYRELGCRVGRPTETDARRLQLDKATAGGRRIAKLRLPLEFPKPRILVQRRR